MPSGRIAKGVGERRAQLAATYAFVRSVERHVKRKTGEPPSSAELARWLLFDGSDHELVNSALARSWANYRRPGTASRPGPRPVNRDKVNDPSRKMMSWARLKKAAERAAAHYGWKDERFMRSIERSNSFSEAELSALADAAARYDKARRDDLLRKWRVITDELTDRFNWTMPELLQEARDVIADRIGYDAIQRAKTDV